MYTPKKIKRIIICQHCQGEGSTEQRVFDNDLHGYATICTKCKACNGHGKVYRIVNISYMKFTDDAIIPNVVNVKPGVANISYTEHDCMFSSEVPVKFNKNE